MGIVEEVAEESSEDLMEYFDAWDHVENNNTHIFVKEDGPATKAMSEDENVGMKQMQIKEEIDAGDSDK